MDLEAARKALAKRSTFSSKRVAFFVVVGLCVIAGILLRSGSFIQPQVEQNAPAAVAPLPPPAAATPPVEATESTPPQVQQNAPVAPEAPPAAMSTAPTEQAEPTGEVVDEPKPAGEVDEQAESETTRLGHNSGRQASRRSTGKSVFLCTCSVWISGGSAVPRDWSRGRLCAYPGLEE